MAFPRPWKSATYSRYEKDRGYGFPHITSVRVDQRFQNFIPLGLTLAKTVFVICKNRLFFHDLAPPFPFYHLPRRSSSINQRLPKVFSRFDSPDRLLAYAGLSPSAHESGKLKATGAYAHMEKRGSRYLRYALFNAAKYVCMWEPSFTAYLAKKRAEGEHYSVAVSHAAKKLVR